MHSIMGTFTNSAQTWFNPSCGLNEDDEGDDPGGVIDPHLPIQPINEKRIKRARVRSKI
jgi:hypothetical protein